MILVFGEQCRQACNMHKIVEIGTHAELLEKNGTYSNLYHLQFKE